jgi:exodeoxyribonuclease V alpha subunit
LRTILCAPTGRAATHLAHSVEHNLAPWQARADTRFEQRCEVGTIHRLLGLTPWGRPRHDRTNPLAADVVVVDEASMLSAHLMACLLDAIGATTRLLLVGDPDQLASVEAGAVLGDIVAAAPAVPVARLRHTYRFSGAIAELAEAIRVGDAAGALSIMEARPADIEWVQTDLSDPPLSADALGGLHRAVTAQSRDLIESALAGDARGALQALESHRLLIPHRQGPTGVGRWTQIVRGWTAQLVGVGVDQRRWYPGLPVLITRNDDVQQMYNGDSGVIISRHGGLRLALSGDDQRLIVPDMIDSWEPLHASTIHKAQGSQFDAVTLLLPPTGTALLTRELFYTAVTRATSTLRIIGTAPQIDHAIRSRALRASGLTSRLGQR